MYLFPLLLGTGCFTSCAPVYVPNKMHAPFFENQGQVEAEVTVNSDPGFEVGGGYALTNNIAIISNAQLNLLKSKDSNYSRNRFIEAGAGYFNKIGSVGRIELFSGAGWGNSDGVSNDDQYIVNHGHILKTSGDYYRIFLQIDAGFSFGGESGNSFELGFIYRPVYVSMLHYRTDDVTIGSDTDLITEGKPHAILHEFGGFYRFKFSNLGVELSSLLSFLLGNVGFKSNIYSASISIFYRN